MSFKFNEKQLFFLITVKMMLNVYIYNYYIIK